jgi:hypothetical protein
LRRILSLECHTPEIHVHRTLKRTHCNSNLVSLIASPPQMITSTPRSVH